MPVWAPFSHENVAIDLSHLEPFRFKYGVTGQPERTVAVSFGSHTFTRKMEEEDAAHHRCFDNRIYCPERYGLSVKLPQVITSLPHRRVYQTWERNSYVYLAAEIETDAGLYHMFFGVERYDVSKRNKGVEMRVLSAYPRLASKYVPPATPNAIGFANLIENTYNGRPIRFQQR